MYGVTSWVLNIFSNKLMEKMRDSNANKIVYKYVIVGGVINEQSGRQDNMGM